MTDWQVVLIILLVLGVIASNIALLRYSAKFKLPPSLRGKDKSTGNNSAGNNNKNSKSDRESD